MSGFQLEQAITDLINLFHKYSGSDDTIEKEDLLRLMKENFQLPQCLCEWGSGPPW